MRCRNVGAKRELCWRMLGVDEMENRAGLPVGAALARICLLETARWASRDPEVRL